MLPREDDDLCSGPFQLRISKARTKTIECTSVSPANAKLWTFRRLAHSKGFIADGKNVRNSPTVSSERYSYGYSSYFLRTRYRGFESSSLRHTVSGLRHSPGMSAKSETVARAIQLRAATFEPRLPGARGVRGNQPTTEERDRRAIAWPAKAMLAGAPHSAAVSNPKSDSFRPSLSADEGLGRKTVLGPDPSADQQ
jgi:hypothetical protein